jgi:hypothetical protein
VPTLHELAFGGNTHVHQEPRKDLHDMSEIDCVKSGIVRDLNKSIFMQVLFALVFALSVNLLQLVLFEILGILSYRYATAIIDTRCGGS